MCSRRKAAVLHSGAVIAEPPASQRRQAMVQRGSALGAVVAAVRESFHEALPVFLGVSFRPSSGMWCRLM